MENNIFIVGEIGVEYTYNDALADYQRAKDAEIINLHISSPGGDLYEGKEIANLFKNSDKIIKAYNIGDVASIATNIFLSAKRENRFYNPVKGRMLIHYPWGGAEGNATELEEYTEMLKKEESLLVKELSAELGVEEVVLRGYMQQDRYLNEEEVELLNIANVVKQEFQAVAKFKINNMNEKEVKEIKGELTGLTKVIGEIKAFIFKPKALMVQDVNGMEIDMPEIETIEQLQVGVTATVDGSPAEGEYILADGTALIFTGGTLAEIKPPQEEDMDALKAENEALKKQIEEIQNNISAKEKEHEEFQQKANEQLTEVEKNFKDFKAKFSKDGVFEGVLEDAQHQTTVRKPFKSKK